VIAAARAFEAFVDGDGTVTEGTTSNLFVLRHHQLLTRGRGILPGVTRER